MPQIDLRVPLGKLAPHDISGKMQTTDGVHLSTLEPQVNQPQGS